MGTRSPLSEAAAVDNQARVTNGQAPRGVSEIQRARLLAAMVDVCAERGVSSATIAAVVSRSGVSRRTFYEHFVDREDCFLAAFNQTVARITAVVLPAYRQPSAWSERIRAGLAALLDYLEVEHNAGRLVTVEALGGGPKALERRTRVIAQIVGAVDEGRGEGTIGNHAPPLTAEGIVGGALSVVHARLLEEGEASLAELVNPLMSMIVLPYLGSATAREELDRPVPELCKSSRHAAMDSLRELDMRLTYRTVRVLRAIGSHPGVSNRVVADASDIRDQGQASKLLARLEHLGLIENDREGRSKGESNMWRLTELGSEVGEALAVSVNGHRDTTT
jgi:AcrR family transcriptional regulator